jgi:hypothetical protein
MRIAAETWARMPEHLQGLFEKVPDEVEAAFAAFGERQSRAGKVKRSLVGTVNVYGDYASRENSVGYGNDTGSASRFYYCAKASKADRDDGLEGLPEVGRSGSSGNNRTRVCLTCGLTDNGSTDHSACGGAIENRVAKPARNTHPTVKPTPLMRYLCRLITPPKVRELVCETCYNDPGGTGSVHNDFEAVQELRRTVRDGSEQPDVLLGGVQGSGRDIAAPSLSGVRQGGQPSGEQVLLDGVPSSRGSGREENALSEAMRVVRTDFPADEEQRHSVLQPRLRVKGRGDEQEETKANGQGVYPTLSAGPSDGLASGLRNGTPPGDGGDVGAEPAASRSSASHQRGKGRQPPRKPAGDAQVGARSNTKAAEHIDRVSLLRGGSEAVERCPSCGGGLKWIERPGVILDPFCGSGSTGRGAVLEGFGFVGIEMNEADCAIAELRIAAAAASVPPPDLLSVLAAG